MKLHKLLLMGLLASGLMLSACNNQGSTNPSGGNSSDTSGGDSQGGSDSGGGDSQGDETIQWEDITYAEFKAAFDAKEPYPYNHLECTVTDHFDGTTNLLILDLNNEEWVIDDEKSTTSAPEGVVYLLHFILTGSSLSDINQERENTKVTYKQYKNEKWSICVNQTIDSQEQESEMVFNEYFCMLQMERVLNGSPYYGYDLTWSTK